MCNLTTVSRSGCKNGQLTDRPYTDYRCVLEENLGLTVGCRDMSHLGDCRTFFLVSIFPRGPNSSDQVLEANEL